jgi:hypothetical protein
MDARITPDALVGSWVHSHEEDTPAEMVFRPASFHFPPSRGRRAFELKPDGSYVESGPGPADRPLQTYGRWTLEGPGRLKLQTAAGGSSQVMPLKLVSPDRLIVGK